MKTQEEIINEYWNGTATFDEVIQQLKDAGYFTVDEE
jgi:hypothetical protein